MLHHQDLVDLFFDCLRLHGSEQKAYKDVEYISQEAQNSGTRLVLIIDAYDEALVKWRTL